jgi:beta-mannosidase
MADGTIASVYTVDLNGDAWTMRTESAEAPAHIRCRALPATVPGCVHTDLLRAGVIPDPLVGMNERETLWIGECDWVYERPFEVNDAQLAHHRLDLVCQGLDTIAEVRVNNSLVGTAANMHHPHRFDLRAAARAGSNTLSITFRSPLKHIRAERDRLGARPVNGDWDPYIFIRKQASNFGWDWAPKLATSGIWQPIHVDAWNNARIKCVRPQVVRLYEDRWRIEADVELEWSGAAVRPDELRLGACLRSPDDCHESNADDPFPDRSSYTLSIELENPGVWWPRGYGEQPLYSLDVGFYAPGEPGGVGDAWEGRVGFRTVDLRTRPDANGTSFEVVVNDRPVFCQGANWIPDGPYAAAASPSVIRHRVEQAAGMGMNMLRVWGGGVYESDAFYRACDELGILVWQDFMFACAMYPEEEPYPTLIEVEARHQVARLSQHPSLALWCGGNECTWAHESWGDAPGERPWKERLEGRTWGQRYYLSVLPRVVSELDPACPYWPNSPWPGQPGHGGNSADHGDRHTWDLRLNGYTTIVPRFISEFGHQSPASRSTLLAALQPEELRIGSLALEHHQRATGGTDRHINDAIREHLGRDARDFEEWHSVAQLLQARAVHTGFAWARVNRGRCMGALVWQLNDCWPGMSWSLIDSGGVEKPAAAAARHALLARQLFILSVAGELQLYAVNDTDELWTGQASIARLDFAGECLAQTERALYVPARGTQHFGRVDVLVGPPQRPSSEYCVVQGGGCRASSFYLAHKELDVPAPHLDVDQIACDRSQPVSDERPSTSRYPSPP